MYLIRKLFLLSIALLLAPPFGLGQNVKRADSLLDILETRISEDEKIDVYLTLAEVYMRADTSKMKSYLAQANEIANRVGDNEAKIDIIDIYGMSLSIATNYPGAEKEFQRTLNESLNIGYQKGEARSYARAGVTYLFRGYLDTTGILLNKALTIQELIDDPTGLAYSYHNLGTYNVFRGNYDKAIDFYNRSLVLKKKLKDLDGQVSTLNGMANTYAYQQLHIQALEYYHLALEAIERGGDDRSMPNIINNMGNIYHSRTEFDKAISYYQRSLPLYQNLGDSLRTALSYKNLGYSTSQIGKDVEAIEYLEKARGMYNRIGNRVGLASVLRTLGEVYSKVSRNAEALEMYNQALVYHREIGDKSSLAMTINDRGFLLVKLNSIQEAAVASSEAMKLALELGTLDDMKRAYKLKAQVAGAQANYREAFEAHMLYKQYNDSLQSQENTRILTRKEADFEFSKEKDSIAFEQKKATVIYEEELKRKETRFQAAVVGGILVLALLGLLYRSYRIKKQNNLELRAKNEEISELRKKEQRLAEETLALKERELTTITMVSHEKNTILQRLEDQIGHLTNKVDDRVIPDLNEIKKTIKSNLSEESWSMFTYQFEKVHPSFFTMLKEQYPSLTKKDLRLCAYLKVGMVDKEIATVTNVTNDGIRKSLYRLKKKMELDAETDLREFLMGV